MNKVVKNTEFSLFKKLPRNIRYGLMSEKTKVLVGNILSKYGLVDKEKEETTLMFLRSCLAGLLKKEELTRKLHQEFKFNNSTTQAFLKDFDDLIEQVKEVGIKSVKEDLVVLQFSKLLEKIPEIKKQEIGVLDIYFPEESQGVTPSIENWITDYKLRKNETQKTTILNVSDYLYNSENTQELDDEEKKQLSIVLNAYENNSVIYYNNLFEQLDFEIIELLEKNKKKETKNSLKTNPNVNITKFESKPYHDTDTAEEKELNKKINHPKVDFKPKPITKIKKKDIPNNFEASKGQVLDLNNYV